LGANLPSKSGAAPPRHDDFEGIGRFAERLGAEPAHVGLGGDFVPRKRSTAGKRGDCGSTWSGLSPLWSIRCRNNNKSACKCRICGVSLAVRRKPANTSATPLPVLRSRWDGALGDSAAVGIRGSGSQPGSQAAWMCAAARRQAAVLRTQVPRSLSGAASSTTASSVSTVLSVAVCRASARGGFADDATACGAQLGSALGDNTAALPSEDQFVTPADRSP
jgi:hypothetical protein